MKACSGPICGSIPGGRACSFSNVTVLPESKRQRAKVSTFVSLLYLKRIFPSCKWSSSAFCVFVHHCMSHTHMFHCMGKGCIQKHSPNLVYSLKNDMNGLVVRGIGSFPHETNCLHYYDRLALVLGDDARSCWCL